MISHRTVASIAAIVLVTAGYGLSQGTSLPDQDVAAIRQLTEQDIPALIAAHDWTGLATKFKEDAIIMPFGEPEVRGKAQIMEVLERNWGFMPITEFIQKSVKIDGRGDLAYARGTYAITVNIENVPEIRDRGKYLVILEKRGGAWLLSTTSYSRDTEKPQVGN